jgi:Carboxypeptidase regulatory-like domain
MNIVTTSVKQLRTDVSTVAANETGVQPGRGRVALGTLRRASLAILMAATAIVAVSVATPLAFSQASSSSDIAGRVTDSTGAAIPGVTITLTNNGTGAVRTTTTNGQGEWSIPNIPPANYKVHTAGQGFKVSEIPSIDVEIGKTANGSVTLSVGAVTDTIEVSTLPPQLQTQEATVGQVIDQKQINDLPLNGRNVLQLANLAPGVSPAQSGQTGTPAQTGTQTSSRQLYIAVDGGRASSTNYVLDGTYVRSIRFNNMSILPNTDTIQEFNLLRSTFSTEYGQGQAIVSMVTKSGSNRIHGTAYEYARNAVFDARNYFTTYASNPVKPDFYRHQYGATGGFPIIKDKLFIFGGFEGLKSARANPLFAIFPTKAELGGDATNANSTTSGLSFSCVPSATNICVGIKNPVGWNPASLGSNKASAVLAATYPTVASDAPNPALNNNTYALPSAQFTESYNSYTVRGDWILSQKNSVFGRYINFDSAQLQPTVNGSFTSNPLLGRNAVLGDTYLFSSNIVNEVRFGWNEFYNIGLAVLQDPNTQWAAAEGLTNVTALTSPRQNGRASFTIAGYTNVGDGAGDQGGHENILSAGDTLSIVHGKHTWKTGFQYQNRRLWQIADNNSRGAATFDNCSTSNCPAGQKTYADPTTGFQVYYNKFQNYARGMCTSACNGNAGTTLGHYRDNTYGAFFNDIWQVGHRVTLTLGMRWEYNSPFVEQNGLEGTLDPTTSKVTFSKIPTGIPSSYLPYYDLSRTYRPGIIEPNKKGFMPRVGLAYEARPGTVFRAGFGIYLDNLNTNELQFTRYAAPLYFQQAFNNTPINQLWPDPTQAIGVAQVPSPFSILPKNTRPYTEEWTASLQQDLGHGMVMELAYTGSETHKSWKRYDQNQCTQFPFVAPSYATTGCTVPAGQLNPNRPYPAFSQGVLTSSTRGDANFHGGSIKIEKRASHGLYYLGSYQWSKNIDNFSGEAAANDSSFATSMSFDRSYSNFDNRNKVVISGGYELPFGKGKKWLQGGVGNALAGGWSLQPAVQLRGGYPFNIARSGCNFAANIGCRAFLVAGKQVSDAILHNPSPTHWFDDSVFTNDYLGRTDNGAVFRSSSANPSVQGWVTRNVLRGPGTANVDFSALKNFAIYERVHAQFRAEAYNILNHPIFSNPANNFNTPSTVGRVTSTSMDNRSIQLAIKVIF